MKHHEFWPPRVFEAPYYAQLVGRSLLRGMSPTQIPKANWALENGEIGLGTKYSTQLAFEQSRFPVTSCITLPDATLDVDDLGARHGFPLIVKPLIGVVGKGVLKLSDAEQLKQAVSTLSGDYVVQSYCPDPTEFGVFFIRKGGSNRISGINQKHFPTVVGDGHSNLGQLATAHPRYTAHWPIFLRYLDLSEVPAAGEERQLSFIGSHTMGCKFTNDTDQLTRALEAAVFRVTDSQPGFNFGRFDVKSPSLEALRDGEFTIIEVNGIASLPTHMFDPSYSLNQAYEIFFEHGRYLVDIAHEHRHVEMDIDSVTTLWQRARALSGELNNMHERAKTR
ncbi:MAG: hypothetical protein RJQ07_11415 [Pseudomonadales bacterium]